MIEKQQFGTDPDQQELMRYTIKNKQGMEVAVTNLGATVLSILVPDREGKLRDVVLGYDTPETYYENTCYFGATIGRGCNRIDQGKYQIHGVTYQLDKNDRGNNLHSGANGFDKRTWKTETAEDNSVVFFLTEMDMENGYPGNFSGSVRYTLTEENELQIHYEGICDQDTLINMTNHTYFNLNGHDGGNIENHILQIPAESITAVADEKAIATGELLSVEGTPLDFRKPKEIGRDIRKECQQMQYVGGYDFNYVIQMDKGEEKKFAEVYSPETGICMTCFTDLPGVQFYAGNMIPEQEGKQHVHYGKRQGLCLESEYFPNAINIEAFAKTVTKAGEHYESLTRYRFSIRK